MDGITGTNKKDKRWWHIEERLTGTKSLIIGKRIEINWSRFEEKKLGTIYYLSPTINRVKHP